jgi:hypothetical protein
MLVLTDEEPLSRCNAMVLLVGYIDRQPWVDRASDMRWNDLACQPARHATQCWQW